MDEADKELISKYFDDICSQEEAERVLQWFDTPEGQAWLVSSLNSDIMDLIGSGDENSHHRVSTHDLDSEKVLNSIRSRIPRGERVSRGGIEYMTPLLKVAASILVILTSSLLYQSHYRSMAEQHLAEAEPVRYVTADEQQKRITLSDGTRVRLNGNSELQVSGDFLEERREVSLTGEAYFDVVHHTDKPFIINAGVATVEVLGTTFHLKALPQERDIQLAVIEGRVSFDHSENNDESTVVLSEGQFGIMDLDQQTISIEEFGVENYLNWMRGRFIFNELSLDKVCLQLNRLYELQCAFDDKSIEKLTLTADFSTDSLYRT